MIWAAGVSAGDALPQDVSSTPGPGGRVRVGADLRLLDSTNVWAVGDAAADAVAWRRRSVRSSRRSRSRVGDTARTQILHVVHGEPTTPFAYHDKGIMATIGRNAAVAELPHGVVVKGRVGWLAWLGLHLWYLVGFRNRLRVFINWTWRYFDWPSGPRLDRRRRRDGRVVELQVGQLEVQVGDVDAAVDLQDLAGDVGAGR